ncbi:MAG: aminomethyl-transferring glycine dehydrogenase subunit GcvPA [Candidatus Cloacimonetes bacterium]|nr:aminomethyl-transferring glycine dehydrogenase subunit GcvPA [Candidatus Cloacimonadota bacterium]
MPYISNTDKERQKMLQDIGVSSFEELIANIPEQFRKTAAMNLEEPYSEWEISKKIARLADKNISTCKVNSFLGGGIYDHYIPAAVDHIILRPEFHTSYTPYQAEVSQGTLQHIYEFQTLICDLTGMEIANASMYDGASAAAEAILMAVRKNRRKKAIIAGTINPTYLEVIKSFVTGIGIELVIVPVKDGLVSYGELENLIDDQTSCVVMQTPNFFGNIEDAFRIEEAIRKVNDVLFIVAVDPISLAVMNAPAEYNADIVVGEGQALGNSQFYGGPLLGFFATKMSLARLMPGRISGGTTDKDGNRAYALTLQAREQHIRREKATSNICSNQSLCALAATVYMCLMGKSGLAEVARQSTTKAHYLASEIAKISGFELMFKAPFFKEFVVKTPVKPEIINKKLLPQGIFTGLDMERYGYANAMMIAVTEKKSKAMLDEFVNALKEVNNG